VSAFSDSRRVACVSGVLPPSSHVGGAIYENEARMSTGDGAEHAGARENSTPASACAVRPGMLAQPYTRRSTLIAVRRQKMTGNPRIGDVAPPRGRLLSEPSLRTSHFSLFNSRFSVLSCFANNLAVVSTIAEHVSRC